jgi:hypothetical protein
MENPNQLNRVQQLEHRLAMVLEDIKMLRRYNFVSQDRGAQEMCNNIEIACDLKDNESLRWTKYKHEYFLLDID